MRLYLLWMWILLLLFQWDWAWIYIFLHSWNPTDATVGAPTGLWVNLYYWHSWNPTDATVGAPTGLIVETWNRTPRQVQIKSNKGLLTFSSLLRAARQKQMGLLGQVDHSLTFDSRSRDENLSRSANECFRGSARGGARTQHVQCGIAALATTFLKSWPRITGSVTKQWG